MIVNQDRGRYARVLSFDKKFEWLSSSHIYSISWQAVGGYSQSVSVAVSNGQTDATGQPAGHLLVSLASSDGGQRRS